MLKRRKLSSKLGLALALIAALAGLLAKNNGKPGQISLPSQSKPLELPPGKARVTKIIDGDTIHVMLAGSSNSIESKPETVRLYGINTPESRPRPGESSRDFVPQPFAKEASAYLEKLCPTGTDVTLLTHDRDRYGRLLAVVVLPDGRDANRLLIEAGFARAYFLRTSKKDSLRLEYESAQQRAQTKKFGLWTTSISD
jgi:micrococcal nuclease